MKTYTIKNDQAAYHFVTREGAWAFMRACDAAGLCAGFPCVRGTVRVAIRHNGDRDVVDRIAGRNPDEYNFKGTRLPEC